MGNKCIGKKDKKFITSPTNIEGDFHKLTDYQLQILLATTDYEEDEIYKWHKEFLKDCPKGRLDKKMFSKLYNHFFPANPHTDEFCKHVFRVFDTDSNGYIDFQEFLVSISITSSKSNYKKKLEWIFNLYDIDSNGYIDMNEFRTVIQLMFKLLDKKSFDLDNGDYFDDLFIKIDIDNNKTISLEEFIHACSQDKYLIDLLAPNL